MLKKVLKSKTMLFAIALELVGVVQVNAEELRTAIDPQYYGYFLIVVGVVVKVLRYATTQPLGDK